MTLAQAYEQRGEQRGEQKGHEKGMKEGLLEGRLEALRALAKKLMQRGEKLEEVAKITGLSMKELDLLLS